MSGGAVSTTAVLEPKQTKKGKKRKKNLEQKILVKINDVDEFHRH